MGHEFSVGRQGPKFDVNSTPHIPLSMFTERALKQAGEWLESHSKAHEGHGPFVCLYVGMSHSGPTGCPYCQECGASGGVLEREVP